MTENKYSKLLDRFLGYVKVNTRSNAESETIPSDPKEVAFLADLGKELEKIGLTNIQTMKDGYLFAELPATPGHENDPVLGFISHVDTADFNSENINPQIIENYDGKNDIKLNDEVTLSVETFPSLKKYTGQTLITTDGTTLLGSDDKSGVAEIVTMVEYLTEHPEIGHGTIKVAFGPDEEIGIGANNFDVEAFGAKFAYTMDGGPLGQLEWETFNAAQATVKAKGLAVHPGEAYGKLVNPIQLLMSFDQELPASERPETTKDRQGFYYLLEIEGDVDQATAQYIIRDHDRQIFEDRKAKMTEIAKKLNEQYGTDYISVELSDQYYNMGEVIGKDMTPVDLAKSAMAELDIEPDMEPIRGGTDGSKITFLGLPTPNLFAGAENMHGRYEYVSLQTMEKAVDVMLKIIELNH